MRGVGPLFSGKRKEAPAASSSAPARTIMSFFQKAQPSLPQPPLSAEEQSTIDQRWAQRAREEVQLKETRERKENEKGPTIAAQVLKWGIEEFAWPKKGSLPKTAR